MYTTIEVLSCDCMGLAAPESGETRKASRHTHMLASDGRWKLRMGGMWRCIYKGYRSREKDGSVVQYLELAREERDAGARLARSAVTYRLGRVDQVDVRALRRLGARPRSEHLAVRMACEGVVRVRGQMEGRERVWEVSIRSLGGRWILNPPRQKLGVGRMLGGLLGSREVQTRFERVRSLRSGRGPLLARGKSPWRVRAAPTLGPRVYLEKAGGSFYRVWAPGKRHGRLTEVPGPEVYGASDFLLEAGEALYRESVLLGGWPSQPLSGCQLPRHDLNLPRGRNRRRRYWR